MSEMTDLFALLKQLLKSQGLTYRKLAEKLRISEASVKRMFSQKELSLSRLEEICSIIQMNMSDLFKQMDAQKKRILQLSLQQEKELVSDLKLLLVAICVLNQWSFEDILKYYIFTEHELIRYFAKLDKMNIIDFQPGNRFKRLIDPDFHWLDDGPIQRFFHERVQDDFLNGPFEKPYALYLVRNGMLSEADNLKFQQKLRKVANEFVRLCSDTVDVPIEKRHGTALMIAMRPWVPDIFDEWKRDTQ